MTLQHLIYGLGTNSTLVIWSGSNTLINLANSAGVLTNDGAGSFSWSSVGTGTVTGTGTTGRITQWNNGAGGVLENSTLIKSGAGVLTLSAASSCTLTVGSEYFLNTTSNGHYGHEISELGGGILRLALNSPNDVAFIEIPTLATLAVPVGGTAALGAGTLTVSTSNDVTGAMHTHAITSSANPGAAASILATDSSGNLTIAGALKASNTTDSISTTTGALQSSGGLGIVKSLVIPTTSGTTGYGLKFDSGANGLVASFQALDSAGATSLFYTTNRYYDGTNWQQLNTRAGGVLDISADALKFFTFPASSSTPTLRLNVANDGVVTLNTGGLIISGTTTGAASSTSFTNVTNTTLTNAYVVKGGQAANTINTGWIKIFIGTNAAWIPYWQNATP